MKIRWIILAAAGAFALAAWAALAIAHFFFEPGLALWTAMLTIAAFALRASFGWPRGVLGWSFLAGRRAALQRLKQRFFGRRRAKSPE